jgi:hypothetical protein
MAPPSAYFAAAERCGHMELSVEALVLDPKWRDLFTLGEREQAAATLSDHGFDPSLEGMNAPDLGIPATTRDELSLAWSPSSYFDLDGLALISAPGSACEVTSRFAGRMSGGRRPAAHPDVRKHLGECPLCQASYPELTAAFERFDAVAGSIWTTLLDLFKATLELGEENLKRFHGLEPEDYGDPEHYEIELQEHLSDTIRPICAWRAIRLGCHLARFMTAVARTFRERADVWVNWRNGEGRSPIGVSVRAASRDHFLLALRARNLLLVRSWPTDDDGPLWLPADEGFSSLPGVVCVEPTQDLGEWEELLGDPPQDLNLGGVLFLTHCAAIAELEGIEPSSRGTPADWEPREQLDRVERSLQAIRDSQDEARENQNAIIAQFERMVLNMKSSDRYSCEGSLMAELPGVYEKLAPEVRNLCLASEQVYSIPGFAAPGSIIHGLATAFELQLRHSVIAGLFDYLKYRKVEKLSPLKEWQDADQTKILWRPNTRPDKCTLGTMKWILQHTHPSIEEFFSQYGMDRIEIEQALATVYEYRNSSAHGECFDIGTAEAIRADWLHWKKRPGGIFSVFFRGE